jgi:hypothetical protein
MAFPTPACGFWASECHNIMQNSISVFSVPLIPNTPVRAEIAGLRHDFAELAGIKRALEAKTWMEYQPRHAGRGAGSVARAVRARRDERGRYVS